MTGLNAIAIQNGWAMAATGALIVLAGLAMLALVIAQLHRIIAIFEKKKRETPVYEAPRERSLAAEVDIINDPAAAAHFCASLTTEMGESFDLAALHQALKKENMPHPHLIIRSLREAGYLVSVGEGLFSWKADQG